MSKHGNRPKLFWLLLVLLFFQGVSATPSGMMLVLDPSGERMQMPLTWLENSPFPNYLIPGLILSIVLGLGAFFVFICLLTLPDWGWMERINPFKRQHWAWTASAAFGLALMIWITVQVLMVSLGAWLQPFYFGVGLAILLLTLTPPVRSYLSARSYLSRQRN
jgi:hypothetical protein